MKLLSVQVVLPELYLLVPVETLEIPKRVRMPGIRSIVPGHERATIVRQKPWFAHRTGPQKSLSAKLVPGDEMKLQCHPFFKVNKTQRNRGRR